MAYNHGREDKKWHIWKEAEEKVLREHGVDEAVIEQIRMEDRADFNSNRRFYRWTSDFGEYLEGMADAEQQAEPNTIADLLDEIEDEKLYQALLDTSTYKKALECNISMTGTNVDFILEGVNKYLMSLAKEQIRLAFEQSEKEVQDLHQRTKEGIETARLNGKQIGQKQGAKLTTKKSIEAKKQIQKHSKDFNGALSDADCMKLIGLARNTFYKYKRELKAE